MDVEISYYFLRNTKPVKGYHFLYTGKTALYLTMEGGGYGGPWRQTTWVLILDYPLIKCVKLEVS